MKPYQLEAVHYQGDVVVHEGATYQALRDTGRAPWSPGPRGDRGPPGEKGDPAPERVAAESNLNEVWH